MLYGWLNIDYIYIKKTKTKIFFFKKKTYVILVGGIPTPLKNDGVRQLG